MKKDFKEIGLRIKSKRIELDMTQEELALKCGYSSRSSINKIELGQTDLTQTKLKLFAQVLNVSPYYLLFGDKDDVYGMDELETEIMKLVIALPFQDKIALYNKLNNISKEDKSEK